MVNKLKEKYPTAIHDPKKDCSRCNGEGDYLENDHLTPCACIYIDHDVVDILAPALEKSFREVYRSMPAEISALLKMQKENY